MLSRTSNHGSSHPLMLALRAGAFGVGMSLCLLSTGGAAAQSPADEATSEVRLEAGMLTVEAENAPLSDVLRAIGAAAGVEPKLRGDLSAPVNLSFGPVPLDEGIRTLAQKNTVILIHTRPEGSTLTPRLAAFRVYGPATGAEAKAARAPRNPAASLRTTIERDVAGSNPQHRIRALRRAAALDPAVGLGIVGDALAHDEDSRVRLQAANALGRIGGEAAAERLESGLADRDAAVRNQVVHALAEVGGQRAIVALGQVLLGNYDAQMRWAAVQALAAQDEEATVFFLQTAAQDNDPQVRTAAQAALSRKR